MAKRRRVPRRGLVIGAGGALGGAWAVGALHALETVEGFSLRELDLVVGTSAGSVLAAMIGFGVSVHDMADRLSGPSPADVDGTGAVNPFAVPDYVHHALGQIPRPVPLPSSMALAAKVASRPRQYTLMTVAAALAPRGRGDLSPVGELVKEVSDGRDWPATPKAWVIAVDQRTGRRVAFGKRGAPETPLPDAIVASCSAPGYFPPATIQGRSYVDGGAVSVTNADLLDEERLDEVLILAPMSMRERDQTTSAAAWLERQLRRHISRRLAGEVDRLRAAGMTVRVLEPTAEDLAAMGSNVMDPRRRRDVLATAMRTTTERLTARPRLATAAQPVPA